MGLCTEKRVEAPTGTRREGQRKRTTYVGGKFHQQDKVSMVRARKAISPKPGSGGTAKVLASPQRKRAAPRLQTQTTAGN